MQIIIALTRNEFYEGILGRFEATYKGFEHITDVIRNFKTHILLHYNIERVVHSPTVRSISTLFVN